MVDPEQPFRTGFGLEKEGRVITGWIHHDALWQDPQGTREFMFRELADIVMSKERWLSQLSYEREEAVRSAEDARRPDRPLHHHGYHPPDFG